MTVDRGDETPRVVVAMDSFKGSLRAVEACDAVRRGILDALPGAEITLRPMADGGEGTAETIIAAAAGEWVSMRVTGPRPEMTVEAGFAWLPDAGPAAVVEMASASGLVLLDPAQRDPTQTTTLGTGELLRAAAERGARRISMAIGGSATVDGGVGAATALGWRFLDGDGTPVPPIGGALERIAAIEPPADLDRLPPIDVLCDVDNPLLGPRGAAAIFGPQKGATPEMVERLERGLAHLADVVRTQIGKDVRTTPGAGAAGGLGAGGLAFMNARLISGVDAVMEVIGIEQAIADADWVITGEGRFDSQSLHGKVVSGIARLASTHGTHTAVLAGSVEVDDAEARANGVKAVLASAPSDMPLDEAMSRADELLQEAARRFASAHLLHPVP